MTVEEKLAIIGLKGNEIKVFLAVLGLGEAAVGQIQKETALHKQLIYHAAEALGRKELILEFEVRGRKRFRVPDPAVIEEQARQRLSMTQELVPELFKRANQNRTKDKIRSLHGQKGVHQYYLDRIRKQSPGSPIRILGINSERYFAIFDRNGPAFQRFETARVEKKITSRLILFGDRDKEIELNSGRKFIDLRLMKNAIQAPMDIMIWETSVGMLFYADESYVLDVAGKDTVDGFGDYFEVLWKQAEILS